MKLYEEKTDGTLVQVQDLPEKVRLNLERYMSLRGHDLSLEEIKFLWYAD